MQVVVGNISSILIHFPRKVRMQHVKMNLIVLHRYEMFSH